VISRDHNAKKKIQHNMEWLTGLQTTVPEIMDLNKEPDFCESNLIRTDWFWSLDLCSKLSFGQKTLWSGFALLQLYHQGWDIKHGTYLLKYPIRPKIPIRHRLHLVTGLETARTLDETFGYLGVEKFGRIIQPGQIWILLIMVVDHHPML